MLNGELLKEANQAYLDADYEQAVNGYETALAGSKNNPYLQINLGNSYYQSQDYGKAILHYYRAKKQIPRNKDLNNNLSLALENIKLSQPSMLAYSWLSLTEIFILFFVLNLLFVLRKQFIRSTGLRFLLTTVFIISAALFSYIGYQQVIHEHAVITSVETTAYSGNNDGYSELFELLNGQVVQVMQKQAKWSKIRHGEQIGWVKNEALEVI